MTISRSLGIPHVVTFHGKDATMPVEEARRSRRGRDLLRKKQQIIDHTGVFIAVSDYIRKSLLAQGYADNKIVVHRNGINLRFFDPPPRQPRGATVLFVGRFVEKKGVRYLIEAAARMQAKGVNFELVLIGDGPLQPELERAARDAEVKCRFPGFLPIEEVRNWLGRAAVVAVPSVVAANGDMEGLPTILLEAQAMQTPLVATRHSGIPEGVKEGVTAELVDEKDVEGLADGLASFIESPAKVERFGASGRQFVADCFDIRNQVEGLEEIYSRLCAERISKSRARV
jgi:glycosyltransferase involved in cell wall biosynthesis